MTAFCVSMRRASLNLKQSVLKILNRNHFVLHENKNRDKLRLIPNCKVLWSFVVHKVTDHIYGMMLPSCPKQGHFHHTSSSRSLWVMIRARGYDVYR